MNRIHFFSFGATQNQHTMKALKVIGIIIVSLIVLYLLAAVVAPKTFNVQRKLTIKADPAVILGEISSYKKWEKWSPWLERDSTVINTYTGPESGVGNKMSWTSKKSGSGTMEILEVVPGKFMRSRLAMNDFTPMEARFTLTPVEGGTEVAWADTGSFPFLWAPFSLVADKMMGPDFERGLANLKKHVEAMPPLYKLGEFKINELPEQIILGVLDSCPAAELGSKFGPIYGEIGAVMRKNKLDFIGPVMGYYYSYSPEKTVFEPAILVAKKVKGEGRVTCRTNPPTKVVSVSFFGDYQYLSKAWGAMGDYLKANKLEQNGTPREVYITDPTTVKTKLEVETRIDMPVK